jgi:hypothetical protein
VFLERETLCLGGSLCVFVRYSANANYVKKSHALKLV